MKRFAAGDSAGYGQTLAAPSATPGSGCCRSATATASAAASPTTPRSSSRGRRHPLVGTVSMDNVTIDLGPETEVEPGDEAVLIGAQGEEAILAEEVAGPPRTRSTTRSPAGSRPGCRARSLTWRFVSPWRRSASLVDRLAAGRRRRGAALGGGEEAWIVGGAVRDAALGREVTDLDLAVAGDPARGGEGDRRASGGEHAFELSAEFGTWRVVAARPRLAGRRRPRCAATAIEADLAARDFTIGAVAVPLAGGEPIDPFGGLADLERGVLRAVGERSFAADPLRLLRAARLAAELGLEIDPGTVALARAAAARAADPAGERQLAELRQLLGGPDPLRGLALLDELGPDRGRPARAGGAARGRAGPQPPPRRPRPHARRARAHARGRGATSSASPASAPPRWRRCWPSRSPTR